MKISFVVHGLPQPAGSKRAFPFRKAGGKLGVAVSDDNPRSRDWKNAVASAARELYGGPLLTAPLMLNIALYFPRPKGHFGKKGLRPGAPKSMTTRPDATKCLRAIEDALQGVLYANDSQIVSQVVTKEYGESGMVKIEVTPMENGDDNRCTRQAV